jgi:hypothetical protein
LGLEVDTFNTQAGLASQSVFWLEVRGFLSNGRACRSGVPRESGYIEDLAVKYRGYRQETQKRRQVADNGLSLELFANVNLDVGVERRFRIFGLLFG